MKASELRIGNWVLTCTPGQRESIMIPQLQAQVQSITLFHEIMFEHTPTHEGFSMPEKHTMGITLTEKWFLKFGFVKYNDGSEDQFVKEFGQFPNSVEVRMCPDSDGWSLAYLDSKIKYVHQLQNLYYALTGEEL